MDRRPALATFAAAVALAVPAAAQAATGIGGLPLALAAAATIEQGECARAALPATGELRGVAVPSVSKASAILGGQSSALDAIRAQQAGLVPAAAPTLPGADLVPRSGGECAMFVRQQPAFAALQPGLGSAQRGADDFLASRRLAVKRTGFDAQWGRVRKTTVSLAGLGTGLPAQARLAAINSWANANIRYVDDRQLYGKTDHWADARTTLAKRAGDCEDIAIVKLALLAGAGVPRDDMYLTVARDLARNADHALLVVRLDGRFWLLDNNTDRLLDGREANDYRPILSYGANGKWLHGY